MRKLISLFVVACVVVVVGSFGCSEQKISMPENKQETVAESPGYDAFSKAEGDSTDNPRKKPEDDEEAEEEPDDVTWGELKGLYL